MSAAPAAAGQLSLRRLASRSSALLVGQLVAAFASFASSVLLSRTLGPQQFGIWSAVLFLAIMVRVFVGFSTTDPLARELAASEDPDRRHLIVSSAWWAELAAGLLAGLAVVMLAGWVVGHSVTHREHLYLYRIVALGLPCAATNALWFAVMRQLHRFRQIGLWMAGPPVVQALAFGGLALTGRLDLQGVALVQLLVLGLGRMVFEAVTLAAALRSEYGIPGCPLGLRAVWRQRHQLLEFWGFMGSSWCYMSLSGTVYCADGVLLSLFNRDSRILGYYRLARQLAAFVETGVTALAHTVYQDFVELVLQHPAEYLQAQMRRLMKLAGQVAAGLFSVSAALAIPLVPLVFGPAYRPAVPLFQLMLIGVMARLVMFPSSPLHMALGNYKYLMKLNIALAPPALVALALVCWRLGAAGAALTVSLYIVLLNLLGTLRLRRLLQSMIRDGH